MFILNVYNKNHICFRVNFKKIIPATEHIKNSEVLSQLNKEALQTKAEMDKEVRKWSTFLRKPDRPIPIRKTVEDIKRETNSYKVHIVKQPKPKVDPNRTPTPPPTPDAFEQAIAEISEKQEPHEDSSRPDTSLSNQTDVKTDIEEDSLRLDTTDAEDGEEKSINDSESNENKQGEGETEQTNNDETSAEHNNQTQVEIIEETVQKTEKEIYLEKQLKEVQNQLMALSNLPFTIQAALNEVTLKLSSIVPQIAQVKEKKLTPKVTPEREENIESQIITNGTVEESVTEEEERTEVLSEEVKTESSETGEETTTIEKSNTIIKTNQDISEQETSEIIETQETENSSFQDWQYERNEVCYFQKILNFECILYIFYIFV